jgi:hypothetical protein
VGVVKGVEGPSPAYPALPADTWVTAQYGAGSYYIPLAYVTLGHPFGSPTDIVIARMIRVVAPIIGVAPAAGGIDAGPANQLYTVSGLTTGWAPGSDRPREYMPATMTGDVRRFLALDFTGGHASLPLNATTVIDDSIDWRNRYFKTTVQVGSGGIAHADTAPIAPHPTGASPSLVFTFIGQSFAHDGYGTTNPDQLGHLAILNQATVQIAASSNIEIFVNQATGNLEAKCAVTSPASSLFVWIDATGPYAARIGRGSATGLFPKAIRGEGAILAAGTGHSRTCARLRSYRSRA